MLASQLEAFMLYLKNISTSHRLARILIALLGAELIIAGKLTNTLIIPAGLGLVTLGITGLVGWCPMCAMLNLGKRGK